MSFEAETIRLLSMPESIGASIIDEVSSDVTYLGYHKPGASTAASAHWLIVKIEKVGNVTTKKYADGDLEYNNVWDNRTILTYEFLK